MSTEGTSEAEREIVIVRRVHGGHEDGHHGGVWKIAYADFMTAMMAFFLVMWLVNAANEETRASVASYFNPIELLDDKPADRSIQDQGEASEGKTSQPAADTQGEGTTDGASAERGRDQNATAGEESEYSEADYFENPYAVLAEIALETGQQANISEAGEGGAQNSGPSTGASGGEAYRDPFDPDFWSREYQPREQLDPTSEAAMLSPEALQEAEEITVDPDDGVPVMPDMVEAADDAPLGIDSPAEGDRQADTDEAGDEKSAAIAGEQPEPIAQQEGTGMDDGSGAPADDAAAEAQKTASPADDAIAQEAAALKADLAEALSGINGQLAEGLDVQPAQGGLLISLTDQVEDSMFTIGSAVPRRNLVLAMEEIGARLAEREGEIVVRGHTDARPFAGEGNNNWRLSTARAHSAYYMLVRGGLDETRIVQISGFADRRLKLPDDPLAAENRRIEILVQGRTAE